MAYRENDAFVLEAIVLKKTGLCREPEKYHQNKLGLKKEGRKVSLKLSRPKKKSGLSPPREKLQEIQRQVSEFSQSGRGWLEPGEPTKD